MSWNPMMGGPLGGALAPQSPDLASLAQAFAQQQPMGGGLPQNTLGASGVTLGNPQAQDQYAEMAQALAQHNRAQQQQDMAAAMMQPKYAENSGGLGSLAMMVQAYAGKKMGKRATADEASARERYYKGQSAAEEAKAAREAQQEKAKIAQRMEQAQKAGLQGQDAAEFAYTGKWPEAVRLSPVVGADGGVYGFNPFTAEVSQSQPAGHQLPPNVHIDPNMSPEDQAIARADAAQGGEPHGETVDYGTIPKPQAGGFKSLQWAQQQQQNQRQTAQDVRAERADARDQARLESQQAAAQAAAADRAKAGQARQAAAAASAQELIDSIDRVTGSKGYGDLGTMTGDALSHVPFMRTEAKDSQAFLDTVANQVATSTMAQLKALSAQGATGFGALSKPELELLKNNIAALSAGNLSHDALDTSLKVVRDKMAKITSWQDASGQAAPAGNGNSRQPPSVSSQAQYDALPSGAIYIEDGKQYRKP